jgi:hypothetical protein
VPVIDQIKLHITTTTDFLPRSLFWNMQSFFFQHNWNIRLRKLFPTSVTKLNQSYSCHLLLYNNRKQSRFRVLHFYERSNRHHIVSCILDKLLDYVCH